jgi:hypothetical protein
MNIEDEIKGAVYQPIWYSVHKVVRDLVWSSVNNRICGSFLQCGRLLFNDSGFSSVRDTIQEYKYQSYDQFRK